MAISKVYRITDAYERGFGTGYELKDYANPQSPNSPEEYEAWQIGYDEGKKRATKENKGVNDSDVSQLILCERCKHTFTPIDDGPTSLPKPGLGAW